MPRILLVEDSATQALALAALLEETGFTAETAPDAERGFARLAEGFDLVLSDLVLPGASGFDLCRRIKADPVHRHLPVVVLTSEADPVNVLRGLEAGADDFMTKGKEATAIAARLHRTLAGHDQVARATDSIRVVFLGREFELSAGRAQLLSVLLSSFEDVVHLNGRYQASERELRAVNAQLEQTVRSERDAHQARKAAQSQLVQAEKLSSLGRMVAGVAHEINNPLAFVSNNMAVLQRDTQAVRELVDLYRDADSVLAEQRPELRARIQAHADDIDLDYTLDSLDRLTEKSREGLTRIKEIVVGLRSFARLDGSAFKEADVNAGIRSTVDILRGKAKSKQVDIELQLMSLPSTWCHAAKLNQVVMNLVANAIDACPEGGTTTISTALVGDTIEMRVSDTGPGVDPAARDHIFEPFFTTKPVGAGTGLGLSISYGIVKEHGGTIEVGSAPGGGACFIVRLPHRLASQERAATT
jgi:signal transduction histidine kinase